MIEGIPSILPALALSGSPFVWTPMLLMLSLGILFFVGAIISASSCKRDDDDGIPGAFLVLVGIGVLFIVMAIIFGAFAAERLGDSGQDPIIIDVNRIHDAPDVIIIEDGVIVKGPGLEYYVEPEPEPEPEPKVIYEGHGIIILEDPEG